MGRKRPFSYSDFAEVARSGGTSSDAPSLWKGLMHWVPMQQHSKNRAYNYGHDRRRIGALYELNLRMYDNAVEDDFAWEGDDYGYCAEFLNNDEWAMSYNDTYHEIGTGPFTMCAWGKWLSINTAATYEGLMAIGTFKPAIYFKRTGGVWGGTCGIGMPSAHGAVDTNRWYHFAMTRAGSTVRLYLNGNEDANSYTSTTDIVNNKIVLANNHTMKNACTECRIFDARWYNRTLTGAELTSLYEDPWASCRKRPTMVPVPAVAAAVFSPFWASGATKVVK
jgi:hypothetical protein